MLWCCACLFVRERPRQADTIVGGYAVCRDHVTTAGALLGRDWASFLVMAGLPARQAERNPPAPPGPPPPRREPPPPTRPMGT
jgi:hypothetical protein